MAVRFNSSSFSRSANLPSVSTGLTVCGYAKFVASTGTYAQLFDLDDGNAWLQLGFNGNNLQLFSSGSGESTVIATLSPGDVFFWALSANTTTSGTVAYFRRLPSDSFSTVSGTSYPFTPTAMYIATSTWGEGFNGCIWNVKCWDRVLTSSEIQVESLYSSVKFPSNLNFHWPMLYGTDTRDLSGNGRTATVNGTVTTEDGVSNLFTKGYRLILPATTVASNTTFDSSLNVNSSLVSTLSVSKQISTNFNNTSSTSFGLSKLAGLRTDITLEASLSSSINKLVSISSNLQTISDLSSTLSKDLELQTLFDLESSLAPSLSRDRSLSTGLLSLVSVPSALSVTKDISTNFSGVSALSPALNSIKTLDSNLVNNVQLVSTLSKSSELSLSTGLESYLVSNLSVNKDLRTDFYCESSLSLSSSTILSTSFNVNSSLTSPLGIDKVINTAIQCNSSLVSSLGKVVDLSTQLDVSNSLTSSISNLIGINSNLLTQSLVSSSLSKTTGLSTSFDLSSDLESNLSILASSGLSTNFTTSSSLSSNLHNDVSFSSSFIVEQTLDSRLSRDVGLRSGFTSDTYLSGNLLVVSGVTGIRGIRLVVKPTQTRIGVSTDKLNILVPITNTTITIKKEDDEYSN